MNISRLLGEGSTREPVPDGRLGREIATTATAGQQVPRIPSPNRYEPAAGKQKKPAEDPVSFYSLHIQAHFPEPRGGGGGDWPYKGLSIRREYSYTRRYCNRLMAEAQRRISWQIVLSLCKCLSYLSTFLIIPGVCVGGGFARTCDRRIAATTGFTDVHFLPYCLFYRSLTYLPISTFSYRFLLVFNVNRFTIFADHGDFLSFLAWGGRTGACAGRGD